VDRAGGKGRGREEKNGETGKGWSGTGGGLLCPLLKEFLRASIGTMS